ncbi:unnamed protein product, partial [Ectocarpus sp. 13 AM-2016]
AAAAAAAAASETGSRDDPPVEKNEDEKEPLPPFTMALAVMLTGLRVLIVDQVLGLHLPVMKLCLASVSCVIENRLESEDNELERRLLRGRRPSSSSSGRHGGSEAAPPGFRP